MFHQPRQIRWVLIVAAMVAAVAIISRPCSASVTLTFDGLQDGEGIETYFAGGSGSMGSQGGANYGITFRNGAYSYVAGVDGVLQYVEDPASPDYQQGTTHQSVGFAVLCSGVVIDVPAGFKMPLDFWYTSVEFDTTVSFYSQLGGGMYDADGNPLGPDDVAPTPIATMPVHAAYATEDEFYNDDGGVFKKWRHASLDFDGTAMSVRFDGPAIVIVFDEITLNSMSDGEPSAATAPEPSTVMTWSVFGAISGMVFWKRNRRAVKLA